MSKSLEAVKRIRNNLEHHYPENIKDFDLVMNNMLFIDVLKANFKISVYHTKHNSTGYEMCLIDKQNYSNVFTEVFAEITEEQYNFISEVLKDEDLH